MRVQVNDVTKKLNLEKERNVQAAKQRAILEAQLSTITGTVLYITMYYSIIHFTSKISDKLPI